MSAHKITLLSAVITGLFASVSLQAAETLKAIGDGEGQLDIVAWPGYIERGESDKAYDWVTGFEEKTGCKVNVKTAATSDEMVSLMTKGGYDLVTASGDASLRLIAGKRVQPINPDLIFNWKNIDSRLIGGPWYVVDRQTYGTPYQWGPNVLLYNTDVFKVPPISWSVVFEAQDLPDGKPNKGRVQAYDGPIYIADAALYLKSAKPELGIVDPYQLTETQYAAVLELLRKQQPLIHRYWHDATVQMSDVKNEGVAASSSWGYMVNGLQADKQPVASTIPQEGATWDVALETLDDWNTMLGWRDLATHQVSLNRDLVKLLSDQFDAFYLLSIPVLALFLVYGGVTIAMAVMLAAAIAGIWMIVRIMNRRRCVRAALLTV